MPQFLVADIIGLPFRLVNKTAQSFFASMVFFVGSSNGADPAVDLVRDDFSRYPAGILSHPIGYQNPAIQEYHYLAHRGVPLSPWNNAR